MRGSFHQLQELKKLYPRMKILISLEGKAASFAEAAQPENRAAFVSSCIDMFVRGHFAAGADAPGIFDGFDLDWEYPQQEDAPNYLALLQEFRKQLFVMRQGPNSSVYRRLPALTSVYSLALPPRSDFERPRPAPIGQSPSRFAPQDRAGFRRLASPRVEQDPAFAYSPPWRFD